jgi:hypothetical protein
MPDSSPVDRSSPESPICPGHGPMRRFVYEDVLIDISCSTCGKQPIDLLERRNLEVWP